MPDLSNDTAANRMSGGPAVFLAATGSTLPVVTGSTITWSNNEVQTLTPTDTVSGGTFTLEWTNPTTGATETTAAIAYDDNADAIKAALAALTDLSASDLTVTGGGMDTAAAVITFGGTYANTPIPALVVDDAEITGGGSLAISETTAGRLWTQFPDAVKYSEKYRYETKDHIPLTSETGLRTDATVIAAGLDQIMLTVEETDIDAVLLALSSTKSTVAAGAETVGYDHASSPALSEIGQYQLAIQLPGPLAGAWGAVRHVYRVRRRLDQDREYTVEDVNKLELVFDVYALASLSYKTHIDYEYVAAATG